jgi:cbb3-type cytochrome oxidase subunit 3
MSFVKTFVLLVIVGLGISFVPAIVRADKYGIDDTQQATGNLLPTSIVGASSLPQLIGKIVAAILSLLALVFFLLVFYAGILWMTARGNSETVTKAKDIMEAAVIGLLIVMGSYAISRFVFDSLVGNTQATAGASSEDPAITVCKGKGVGDSWERK